MSPAFADNGLAGREIETQITELGVRMLLLPDRRDERARNDNLGGFNISDSPTCPPKSAS